VIEQERGEPDDVAMQAVLLPGGVLLRSGSEAWFGAAVVP